MVAAAAPLRVVRKTIRLHRAQADFRRSPALYRGFVGGRGAGKSWVGAYDLIRRARRGRTYLVASPTGVLLGDTTFPTFKALARDLGVWDAGGVRLTPYPSVTLATGATVRFRTAEDPERMRGPNLSGVWLDEASLMPEDAYTIAIASLREAGEQGWLSATFTPKGRYHWTYEVFGKARKDTELFRARTGDNPFNPPGFEDTLRHQYAPQLARQELGGEFLDIEGAEWPAAWFPDSHWFRDWPERLTLRVIALDPSKGQDVKKLRQSKAQAGGAGTDRHGDYSAFALIGRDAAGTLWVEADLDHQRTTTQIVTDGIAIAERFERETRGRLDGLGVESDQFMELMADEFVRRTKAAGIALPVYTMTTGNVPKAVRIRRLTPYLSRGNFRWRDTPGTRLLVRQMQEFPLEGPGYHDDGPDALEYGIRLAIRLWNGKAGKK